MKKLFTLIFLSLTIFSFAFKRGGDGSTTHSVIIQFSGYEFEKRMPEILTNLKGIKGLIYLSHCVNEKLIVMDFDLHTMAGFAPEKVIKEKIPVEFGYDVKEGTIKQVQNNFGNCLIKETL